MIRLINSFLVYRRLVFTLAWRDLTSAYSGSVVGSLWAVVDPLVYIALSLLFFQFAIKGVATNGVPYVAWVLPAIVLWTFLTSVINSSVNSLREYSYLMRHSSFDIRLVAVIKLLSSLFVHMVLIAVLVTVLGAARYITLGWNTLAVFYYLAASSMLLVGLSWLLSALGVFWKDVRNLVSMALQLGFWISPIFWTPGRFPRPVSTIMYLNPFYYPIDGFRAALLSADFGSHFWLASAYFWSLTIFLLWLSSRIFKRLSRNFGDVL